MDRNFRAWYATNEIVASGSILIVNSEVILLEVFPENQNSIKVEFGLMFKEKLKGDDVQARVSSDGKSNHVKIELPLPEGQNAGAPSEPILIAEAKEDKKSMWLRFLVSIEGDRRGILYYTIFVQDNVADRNGNDSNDDKQEN